ncbi:MAG: TetR/AcrR family transcriptional regulator C-terminal domain-containing protein [Firmicutes bacterium]|nr:TetR/AcrR family transcriptional regulator C-terminal domain-containing protein [Bacillota bacterium]
MASRTKKEIAAATQELLREKPLHKITVKEITQKCDLTRNSFYYHFDDIYDVVNYIFEDEVEGIVAKYVDNEDWEAGFLSGINYLYENRDMIYHIYRTVQHENIDTYLGNIMDSVVYELINHLDVPEDLSEESKKITALVYRSAFAGVIQQWIHDDMATPPEAVAVLCDEIFRATVLPILTSSQKALDILSIDRLIK